MAKKDKALTRTEKLLRLMRDGRTYRASTLAKTAGWRFGSAVSDLRDLGCYIISWQHGDGEWRYQLTYTPYSFPANLQLAA